MASNDNDIKIIGFCLKKYVSQNKVATGAGIYHTGPVVR
jgi:hypothetical protein